ncbi:hypothetical protein AB1K70_21495 [Bremerella sp. JC770]|uniref:hypothetical protein n=1 Tax=Bremerella sp. JC770 TaxID=3232137 RepID=UPI0034579D74
MPISFHCETCRRSICVPDGSEGKKTRCPECYSIVRVPFSGNATLLSVPDEPKFATPVVEDPLGITGKTESRWDNPESVHASPATSSPIPPVSPAPGPAAKTPSPSPPSPSLPGDASQPQTTLKRLATLKVLATVLMAFGVIALVVTLLFAVVRILALVDQPTNDLVVLGKMAGIVVLFFVQLGTVIALNEARIRRNYTTARTGMILAILPFSNPAACLLLPLALTIWGLAILLKRDVRAAFKSEQGYTPD